MRGLLLNSNAANSGSVTETLSLTCSQNSQLQRVYGEGREERARLYEYYIKSAKDSNGRSLFTVSPTHVLSTTARQIIALFDDCEEMPQEALLGHPDILQVEGRMFPETIAQISEHDSIMTQSSDDDTSISGTSPRWVPSAVQDLFPGYNHLTFG